jgi:HK97 family phage portal protein
MRFVQILKNSVRHYFGETGPEADEQPRRRAKPQKEADIRTVEEFEKGGLNEDRYDRSDPMVADRYAVEDLADFLDLYSTHVWVYRCANAIAKAAASVKYSIKSNGEEISAEERPSFLLRPNPHMTWYELIETTFLHLELAGNAYWEVVKGEAGDGKIEFIFPLRPDRMKIEPDAKKKVKQYVYSVPGNKDIEYKPEEILHLKYTDAKDEFYGVPPVAAAKNDIILDFYATAWNKKFFKDGAEPGAVLETDQTLTDMAFNRLKAVWNKRHRGNPHEVAILEEGLKYKQITSKHADMQYLEGKKMSRDTILAAMHVPPVIVGLTEGVSYATSNDQKKIFWQHNIIPKLEQLEAFINSFLMPEKIAFNFITKTLASIIEDEEVKSRIAQANVSHGIWTINEARRLQWDMAPVEWGDTWQKPIGLVDVMAPPVIDPPPNNPGAGVTSGSDAGMASPTQVPIVNPRAPETQTSFTQADLSPNDLEKYEVPDPDWNDPLAVSDWHTFNLWKVSAGPDDRAIRRKIRDFFKAQGQRLAKRIESKWPVQKANEFNVETFLFDLAEEDGHLRAVIRPEAERLVKKYGNQLLVQMKSTKRMDLESPAIKNFLDGYAAARVRHINDHTRDLLRTELNKAYDLQEGVKAMMARVNQVFEGNLSVARAQRIARTEIVTLTNTGRFQAAQESGVVQVKRWISEQLPTTRDEKNGATHRHMHGKVVPLNEPFEAPNRAGGFDKMMHPGDLSASAENVCNCVCVASFFSGSEEFADIILGKMREQAVAIQKEAPAAPQPVVINNFIQVPPANPTPVQMTVQPTPVHVENNVDVQPTPVNVENKVDVQPTPIRVVNEIENNVDVQPTPVKVENTVNVEPAPVQAPVEKKDAPPVINVTVTPQIEVLTKMPAHNERIVLQRDEKGRITGAKKECEGSE